MHVRWTAPAAQDIYLITVYIRRDNVAAAREVAKSIYESCESLAHAPFRGRQGRIENTRELVIAKLPYIVVYRIIEDTVEILHVYHGARNWPNG